MWWMIGGVLAEAVLAVVHHRGDFRQARASAEYSHCRFSLPVTSAIPVYRAALRRMAGDRVGPVRCAVAAVGERTTGEAPGAGDGVSVEHAADLDAAGGDGLDR